MGLHLTVEEMKEINKEKGKGGETWKSETDRQTEKKKTKLEGLKHLYTNRKNGKQRE